MRVLYLIIGLLAGISWTSRIGTHMLAQAEQYYDRDLTARTLTGYYEGWARGRMQSDGFWAQYVEECRDGQRK